MTVSELSRYLQAEDFFHRLYSNRSAPPNIQARHVEAIAESHRRYEALPPKNNSKLDAWLKQRDDLWNAKAPPNDAVCMNCAINASCYEPEVNTWHPSKCSSGLKEFRPDNVFLSEKCFNLSVLILGDSRGRFMLMGLLRRFYPEWIGLHRYVVL